MELNYNPFKEDTFNLTKQCELYKELREIISKITLFRAEAESEKKTKDLFGNIVKELNQEIL